MLSSTLTMRPLLLLLLLACAPRPSGSWSTFVAVPTRGQPARFASMLLASRAPAARAMFSGIVEEMGKVRRLEKVDRMEMWDGSVGEGWELEVEADVAVQGATLGCSIAVNGVCLTAIEFDETSARFGLAPETLRRSNLAKLKTGDPVNLERALPADGRNSGHFVQGHVDDVGEIVDLKPDGDSLYVTVKPPSRILPYIVPKGSVKMSAHLWEGKATTAGRDRRVVADPLGVVRTRVRFSSSETCGKGRYAR